jgi:hypothetical protein
LIFVENPWILIANGRFLSESCFSAHGFFYVLLKCCFFGYGFLCFGQNVGFGVMDFGLLVNMLFFGSWIFVFDQNVAFWGSGFGFVAQDVALR